MWGPAVHNWSFFPALASPSQLGTIPQLSQGSPGNFLILSGRCREEVSAGRAQPGACRVASSGHGAWCIVGAYASQTVE
jgi:hypothetical protein